MQKDGATSYVLSDVGQGCGHNADKESRTRGATSQDHWLLTGGAREYGDSASS